MRKVWLSMMIMVLAMPLAAAGPTGCEWFNATVLKCWNQGSIENETYVRDDAVQIANAPDRLSWGSYSLCLMNHYDVTNATMTLCQDDLSFMGHEARSDNLTFWAYNGSTEYFEHGYGQGVDDDYVNMSMRVKDSVAFLPILDYYVGWCLDDIDVGTPDQDVINLESDGEFLSIWTNQSEPFLSFNVTGDYVMVSDFPDTLAIKWRFTEDNRHAFSWNGSRMCSFTMINQSDKRASFEWIDIPECSIFCDRGVTYFDIETWCISPAQQSYCNASNTTLEAELRYRAKHSGIIGAKTACDYGTGCYVETWEDAGGGLMEMAYKDNQTENDVVALSYSYDPSKQDAFADDFILPEYSNSRLWKFKCRSEGNPLASISAWFNAWDDWGNFDIALNCPDDDTPPSVHLQGENASIAPAESIVLSCNSTDLYPLRNSSLFANFTGSWAVNASNLTTFPLNYTNLSSSIAGLSSGFYVWNCYSCDNNDLCAYAPVNHSITVSVPAVAAVMVGNFKPYRFFGDLFRFGWWL